MADHHTPLDAARNQRLFRMEGRLTELVTVGLLTEGLRMRNSFEGVIISGELEGARIRGVDEFLIRADGIGVVDAREVVESAAGNASAVVLGYGRPPAGLEMPPLEVLLEPSFEWPDARFMLECGAIYRSPDPALAELARTAVVHLGWVNMATRELVIEGFSATALVRHSELVAS